MYFNDNSGNTNIDNNSNNADYNIENKSKNKKIILVIVIIILTVILVGIIFFFGKKNEVFLTLNGNTEIILYRDSVYNDPGYKAYDSMGHDLTSEVIVSGNVDTSISGDYTITYTLNDIVKERNITIISQVKETTYLSLIGASTIFLKLGEEYVEPGYTVVDNVVSNLKDKVIVNGSVGSTAGTYKIKYSVTNKEGKTFTAERTIIIVDPNINVSYAPKGITNRSVKIDISVIDNYFDYILLPDGNKSTERNTVYKVDKNGKYKFVLYSTDGTIKEASLVINNIDKVAPKIISCIGTITDGRTTLTVNSNDTDIKKYVFADSYESASKTYTIDKEFPTTTVRVFDNAGNSTEGKCTATYTYDKPIDPSGGENIIQKENTSSLRVWIEKKARSGRTGYYVTHIWAMNPYKQIKSNVPDKFGKELKTAKTLFTNAISKNKLSKKLAVAMNGSGFAQEGVFSTSLIAYNKSYNMTSISPIVIVQGNVLRDFATSKVASSPYVYGINKNGDFAYYNKYTKGNNLESNKNVSNQIINDGVLNTWAFSPVLVENGKVASSSTDKNIRNGICQIDKNNFAIITDIYKSPRDGFSYKELGEYMTSIGCKTGFNFDGGGSTTLLFKSSKNSSPTQITSGSRSIADILYFHEL